MPKSKTEKRQKTEIHSEYTDKNGKVYKLNTEVQNDEVKESQIQKAVATFIRKYFPNTIYTVNFGEHRFCISEERFLQGGRKLTHNEIMGFSSTKIALGYYADYPDAQIDEGHGGYFGWRGEFKAKKTPIQDGQKVVCEKLNKRNYKSVIVRGYYDIIVSIIQYLTLPLTPIPEIVYDLE